MPSPRRRVPAALALLAASLALAGAAPARERASQPPASAAAVIERIDRARLMRDLATLADPSLDGRRTGTPGGLRARAWVEGQFRAIGLQPAGSAGYLQPFDLAGPLPRGPVRAAGSFRRTAGGAANVLGLVPGSAAGLRTLLVSAHYDHIGVRNRAVHPGADDNASGVAVLLAVARDLRDRPPRHPVLLIAFDAEEIDLAGSRAFVASPLMKKGSLAVVVNLDMVSRSDRNEIFAAGTSHSPWLRPLLDGVRRRSAVTLRFGHDSPGPKRGADDWTLQSDHGPFHEAGVPFVYFGVEDHADYHAPSDTADKVDPRFFGGVAETILDAVRTLDRGID
jgi:hypothetical protein